MKKPKAFKGAWKFIAADFIIKLPPFKDSITEIIYNSILVITNRLTKYIYFIPYLKIAIAKDFAHMFIRNIFANYKILIKTTLDRNKLFTFKFWKSIIN